MTLNRIKYCDSNQTQTDSQKHKNEMLTIHSKPSGRLDATAHNNNINVHNNVIKLAAEQKNEGKHAKLKYFFRFSKHNNNKPKNMTAGPLCCLGLNSKINT